MDYWAKGPFWEVPGVKGGHTGPRVGYRSDGKMSYALFSYIVRSGDGKVKEKIYIILYLTVFLFDICIVISIVMCGGILQL